MAIDPYKVQFMHESTPIPNETDAMNPNLRLLQYPFNDYEIGIVTDTLNRFVCVKSIRIKKGVLAPEKLGYSDEFSAEKLLDDFLNNCED